MSAAEDPDPCPVDGGSHDWETFTYTSPGTGRLMNPIPRSSLG